MKHLAGLVFAFKIRNFEFFVSWANDESSVTHLDFQRHFRPHLTLFQAKMSSRKTAGRRGTTKKRAQRATSNVFAIGGGI